MTDRYVIAQDLIEVAAPPSAAYRVVTNDSGSLALYNVQSDGTLLQQYTATTTIEHVSMLTSGTRVIGIEGAAFAGGLIGVQAIHSVDMVTGTVSTHSIASGRFASPPALHDGRLWWAEAPEGAVGSIEIKLMSSTLALASVQEERSDTHTGGSGGGSAPYEDRFGAYWLGDEWAAVSTDQGGETPVLTNGYAWELDTTTDQSSIVMAFTASPASPRKIPSSAAALKAVPATVAATSTWAIRRWDGDELGGNPFTSLYLDSQWPSATDTLGVDLYVDGSTVHRLYQDVFAGSVPWKIGTLTTAGGSTPEDDITLNLTGVTGTPAVLGPST